MGALHKTYWLAKEELAYTKFPSLFSTGIARSRWCTLIDRNGKILFAKGITIFITAIGLMTSESTDITSVESSYCTQRPFILRLKRLVSYTLLMSKWLEKKTARISQAHAATQWKQRNESKIDYIRCTCNTSSKATVSMRLRRQYSPYVVHAGALCGASFGSCYWAGSRWGRSNQSIPINCQRCLQSLRTFSFPYFCIVLFSRLYRVTTELLCMPSSALGGCSSSALSIKFVKHFLRSLCACLGLEAQKRCTSAKDLYRVRIE
jgi:hypothetical protein